MNLATNLWPACVSALQLDKLRTGESVPGEVRAHVAGCDRCSAALAQLDRAEELPPLRVVPLQKPRRRWHRVGGIAALAAAASVLLVLRSGPSERSKGAGVSLAMYVDHLGEVRQVQPGGAVSAGDVVRFAVTLREPRAVAVLSVDPEGHASIYAPTTEVPAGDDHPLPSATRLDSSKGAETVVGIFCARPVALEPLRAALERGKLALPDGCEGDRWTFIKR